MTLLNGRSENSDRKRGTRSTAGRTMYLHTDYAKDKTHCQVHLPTRIDHNAGSYPVKHHYPSPIVSWIEDLSSFGNAPFSHDTEYVDEPSRPSVIGQSSASSSLHDMQIVRSVSFLILS